MSDTGLPAAEGRRIRGIVFDLDGTLVDSGLDFPAIRREMGLPAGLPILETMAQLEPEATRWCQSILDRHERRGALRAKLLPGVVEFLDRIAPLGFRKGIITRNSRMATELTLRRCRLDFRDVLTRDDGPVKPDPWAIHQLCRRWGVAASAITVCGDYRFDLEAGRAAGARTVLVCNGRAPCSIPGHELADLCLGSFADSDALIEWLDA